MLLEMFGISKKPEETVQSPEPEKPTGIDWSDLNVSISKYFTVKNATWLPQEGRAVSGEELSEEIKANLISTFQWMDKVREWAGSPITVTICIRTMKYHLDLYKRLNSQRAAEGKDPLRIPMGSMHLKGKAVDFVVKGISCDDIKKKILDEDKLEEWGLRMEDNGAGAGWVHLDDKESGPSGRFFKP
jgi:hypothetical protein